MAHKTLIGGTAYDTTGGKCLVGGTGYSIQKGRTLVGGTGYDISFSNSVELSTLAVGSIVKLKESGSLVEFYVAKHDYESELNGSGRTLLVRKDCYDTRIWRSSGVNAYDTSTINNWLNYTYNKLLDSDVQTAISKTKFYYTPGNNNTTVTTTNYAVFLLSAAELGKVGSTFNTEGTELPIASTLQIAYLNGSAVAQWTRTPYTTRTTSVVSITKNAAINSYYNVSDYYFGSRPVFTLPSTTLFNPDTLEYVS